VSLNNFKPHMLLVPEDEALMNMAIGFAKTAGTGQIRPERQAGGRDELLEQFCREEIPKLRRFPERFLILLTDFDNGGGNQQKLKEAIPADLIERVCILGPWTNAEVLRAELRELHLLTPNSKERVGEVLAESCLGDDLTHWEVEQLKHLRDEVVRVQPRIHRIVSH